MLKVLNIRVYYKLQFIILKYFKIDFTYDKINTYI